MCFATSGCVCVRSSMRFLNLWLQIALWNCCMMLHGLCVGEEAGARNLVFPCKVAAAGDESYLVCAAVAAGVVLCANCFLLCVLPMSGCVSVRSSMRFLNLWLQIALVLWLLKRGFCTRPSPSFVWLPPMSTMAQCRYPPSAVAQRRSPSSGSCYNIHQYFRTWFFMFLSLIDACCLVLVKSNLRACVAGCCHLLWHFFFACSYACCLSPRLRHLLA